MPFAFFSRVREVSSEDNQHLAENLINLQPGKKWKTQNAGEKSAYVILEMSDAHQITGIDIGNEHSAFVEVLVGKSNSLPDDFKEILITCSFMTPIESRSSDNTNRVRCFNEVALVPTTAEKKWSLVKVICTQPFNKHVQYGLSFIKVHVAQTAKATPGQQQNKLVLGSENNKPSAFKIGKFHLREDSPDSESEGTSNLFNRWRKSKDDKSERTAAASIRSASNSAIPQASARCTFNNSTASRPNKNVDMLDRNRDTLLFGEEKEDIDSEKESRLTKKIEADKQRRLTELQKQSENKRRSTDVKRTREGNNTAKDGASLTQTSDNSSITNLSANDSAKKRQSSPCAERPSKKEKAAIRYKPFNELLRGVVLVISGIQNPDRADLRSKALALGAKYKGDWDNTCTHLISAFKNTPKYNQVRGKGKIITRTWIEKCYNLKKYIPWRRYALDSQELAKPESDEEILGESLAPHNNLKNPETSRKDSDSHNHTLSLYDLGERQSTVSVKKQVFETSSDSDTDEEIQRIERRNQIGDSESQRRQQETIRDESKAYVGKVLSQCPADVYDLPTDEEDYLQDKNKQVDRQTM